MEIDDENMGKHSHAEVPRHNQQAKRPLAITILPLLPKHLTSLSTDELLELRHYYPVAYEGLLAKENRHLARALEVISYEAQKQIDVIKARHRNSTARLIKQIEEERVAYKTQQEVCKVMVDDRATQIEALSAKVKDVTTTHTEYLVANAGREAMLEIWEAEANNSSFGYQQIWKEREFMRRDVDQIRSAFAQELQKKDAVIAVLRAEVSRLLNKNVMESLQYNDLLADHGRLQEQLWNAEDIADTVIEEVESTTIVVAITSRSRTSENSQPAEDSAYHTQLLQAKKQTRDAKKQCNKLTAEKDYTYRSLQNKHADLKRKYDELVENATANTYPKFKPVEESSDIAMPPPPKKRKTRASTAVSDKAVSAKSDLSINLKVFSSTATGAVQIHVAMEAMDSSVITAGDFSSLQTVAWNLLRSSCTGHEVCGHSFTDDFSMIARVKSFPGGTWETVNEGGFRIWLVAAEGLAKVLEQGLIGEVDVMFAANGLRGEGWVIERSIRMADALAIGDGFAQIEH